MASGFKGVARSLIGSGEQAIKTWVSEAAEAINRHNQGKFNASLDVTLTANAASTTITDARISRESALVLSPLTANAAAALATTYPSFQGSGSAVLAHANNAQTDKSFRIAILG